jgi:hypothetical protein
MRSVQGNLLSEQSRSGWFFPKPQTFFAVIAGMTGDGAGRRVCPLSGLRRATAQAVLGCGRLAAGPELNFAVLLRFRPLEPIDL